MKMRLIPISLAVLIVGCTTSRQSAWVYPGSHFVRNGPGELGHQLQRFLTDDDLRPFITSNIMPRVQADPFHHTDSKDASFTTSSLGMEIDMFYDHVFLQHGWRKARGMFPHEMTSHGPDYVSVYSKGDKFVKIHMCGPWDHPLVGETFAWSNAWFTMSFIGLHPEELLGKNYRESEQTPAGAVLKAAPEK